MRGTRLQFVRGPFVGNGEPYINYYDLLDSLVEAELVAENMFDGSVEAGLSTREQAALIAGATTMTKTLRTFFMDAKESSRI